MPERGNALTDVFGIIDHLLEHLLDERFKMLLESGKQRSVRNFGEATEIPQFLAKF